MSFSSLLKTKYFVDKNRDVHHTIILAGTGRSGTTWLSNVINYDNKYRYMFEPLFPNEVPLVKENNIGWNTYIRPGCRDDKRLVMLETILSGELRNTWVDRLNKKILVKDRLIKVIRGNMILKWIHQVYPYVPKVFVIRHPFAVANSIIKNNWIKDNEKFSLKDQFYSQEKLVEDFLGPLNIDISNITELFDKLVFVWCVQNYVPIRQFKHDEIYFCFYEDLCTNPEIELPKLFNYLGKKIDDRIYDVITIPSNQARANSAIRRGESLIESWKKSVTIEEKIRAQQILNIFGFESLYDEYSMPNHDVFKGLFGRGRKVGFSGPT
ncbi:MAG: hypothetical protein A2Z47_11075 [Thermodesulfovibrio sp. RBG_19FT_COMBO_42_12]|nr:MAG: hypothetical protein A2Z47_11075 [Thermodesulfovibrio sp. RBG_19FT_COMBO_42_12]